MYNKEEESFAFTGELDGIWAKSQWLEIGGRLVPGGYILFDDPQFQPEGVRIRITGKGKDSSSLLYRLRAASRNISHDAPVCVASLQTYACGSEMLKTAYVSPTAGQRFGFGIVPPYFSTGTNLNRRAAWS